MLSFSRTGQDDGPIVVFLHAVGISGWMWSPIVARLPEMHCLCIDLPGHGASREVRWSSLTDSAMRVAALIDREAGSRDVHVVGLSLGAYVGLTLLSQRPTRYRSAMLSGFHAGGMPNRFLMRMMSSAVAPLVNKRFFARRTARMLGGDPAETEAFVAEAIKTRSSAFRRATVAAVEFAAPTNLTEVLTRTLVVAGGREHDLIQSSIPIFQAELPQCTGAIAPGLGHGWSSQDPDLFAETVRAHVNDTKLPSGLEIR